MKNIPINRNTKLATPQNYQFIPLGNSQRLFGNGGLLDQVRDRIFKKNSTPVEDFWATVGRQDGQAIDWTGSIVCSGNGNDRSTGVTSDEIAYIKELYPEVGNTAPKALEKVVVFDNVSFGVDPESRKIRLTLMVDPGEGAVVYYQHTGNDDTLSQEGEVEYIQPANTPNYNDNQRDRLDYMFDVPPKVQPDDRFIVKAITFKRNASETPEMLLRRVEKPYHLLRYNPDKNDPQNNYIGSFEVLSEFDKNGNPTGNLPAELRTKKTLLLIHGTFSTTNNSYGGLLQSGWLKNVITSGLYEQVLALDHPSIFEGPADNVAKMKILMGAGPKFTHPVHIITTSRGGLVGKTIVNDKEIHDNFFEVERMAAVACANGVEYFSAGWKIVKGLAVLKSLFKMTGRAGLATFTAIAQVGSEVFLMQPGAVAMTPGSQPLEVILTGTPVNPGMRYFPLTGNFIPTDAKQKILDLLIKIVYKEDPNDWVVGTKQQAIMPEQHYAYGTTKGWGYDYYLSTTFSSIHTQYFTHNPPPEAIPRETVLNYLKDAYANIL